MPTEKECKVCKVPKPLTEYYAQKGVKDGVAAKCKTCHNQYTRAYLKAHRPQHKEAMLRYYYRNKEQCRSSNKAWYEANKEKAADYQKQWRKANPDKVKSYYRKRNQETT